MPKMTAGNRLYFYQLLSTRIGTLRQVPLAQVEELFEAEDLRPEDVGAPDIQGVMELLHDFVRLTVFKKGRVYVTVQPQEDWDAVLARAAGQVAGEKAAPVAGARSWKHKKSNKDPKPAKPWHQRAKKKSTAGPEPEVTTGPEPEVAAGPATAAPPTTASLPTTATEPEVAAAEGPTNESMPAAMAKPEVTVATEPEGVTTAAPEAATKPMDAAEVADKDEVRLSVADPGAGERPVAPSPEPTIRLTITYDPYDGLEEELARTADTAEGQGETEREGTTMAAESQPDPAAVAKAEPVASRIGHPAEPSAVPARPAAGASAVTQPATPALAPSHPVAAKPIVAPRPTPAAVASPAPVQPVPARPAPTPSEPAGPVRVNPLPPVQLQADLPRDFQAEVSCKLEALERLYALLPTDVDVLATLDEDWRVARSTGSVHGSRSQLCFPLRYLRADGSAPLEVTLRRNTRTPSGKRWSMTGVDDGGFQEELPDVGLEGLSPAEEGAWQLLDFAAATSANVSPERELAQFAVIGPWEPLLAQLAAAAEDEPWSLAGKEDLGVLREYLCLTFWRARHAGLVVVADDGSLAGFNTGLLTACGQYLCMSFVPHEGDIPWQFAGWVVDGDERLSALEPADATGERHALPLPEPLSLPQTLPTLATLDLTPGLGARLAESDDDLLERSLRRVRQSPYQLAAAYDPRRDGIALLLPLWPASGSTPESALALAPEGDGRWRGCAILSLANAYTCARSLSRDMPSWLAGALG